MAAACRKADSDRFIRRAMEENPELDPIQILEDQITKVRAQYSEIPDPLSRTVTTPLYVAAGAGAVTVFTNPATYAYVSGLGFTPLGWAGIVVGVLAALVVFLQSTAWWQNRKQRRGYQNC